MHKFDTEISITKILVGENFGEFGETTVICQYFTQPNSRFAKVAKVTYYKFANIFLANSETIDSPKFYPPKSCTIR